MTHYYVPGNGEITNEKAKRKLPKGEIGLWNFTANGCKYLAQSINYYSYIAMKCRTNSSKRELLPTQKATSFAQNRPSEHKTLLNVS